MTNPAHDSASLRALILEVISSSSGLQTKPLLSQIRRRLIDSGARYDEQAVLTYFYDLFRIGYLSWGLDLSNPEPPFIHVTDIGRKALQSFSRDPANPDGYLAHLAHVAPLPPTVTSYVEEALRCYGSHCFRAAAVMIGAAAESIILDLRDALLSKLQATGAAVPRGLEDWRIKTVLDAIESHVTSIRTTLPRELLETFDAHWSSFTGQVRLNRNAAGHPSAVSNLTEETTQASLLIFPELARLSSQLKTHIC